jgi:hypothetical protein
MLSIFMYVSHACLSGDIPRGAALPYSLLLWHHAPLLEGEDGAFARVRRVPAYLSWTVPREPDRLVFKANGGWVPDRPQGLPMEWRRGNW